MNEDVMDSSDIGRILERNGYLDEPEFVLRGRLTSSSLIPGASKLGTGVSAVAAFGDFLVHVFGRLGNDTGSKLLASDQVVVREVPFSDLEGVDVTVIEGVGAVVTVSVKGRGGILNRALAGGDVVVTIRKSDIDNYRPLVEKLRQKIA